MKKLIITTLLLSLISCSYTHQGQRKPASAPNLDCLSTLVPFLKANERRLATLKLVKERGEEITDAQIKQLFNVIDSVDNGIIAQTEKLEAPKNTDLLIHRDGMDAYFNPLEKVISIPYQFSEEFISHYKTPWAKEVSGEAADMMKKNVKLSKPSGEVKAVAIGKWITEQTTEPHRGLLKEYKKHPKHSRSILAHEYGHSVLHQNLPKMNKAYNEYSMLVEKLGKVKSAYEQLKSRSEKSIDEFAQKLTLSHSDLDRSEIDKLPEMIEFNKEWNDKLFDSKVALKNMEQEVWNCPFRKQASMDFDRYNELFADLTSIIYNKGDPKAVSSALGFTKTIQDHKKYNTVSTAITNRDFSDKANRIDNWAENSLTRTAHNAMAPTRYYLYDRFLKRPYYQSGEGAGKLYEKVLEVISEEVNFRIDNPETRLKWVEWNQRFIDLMDKETADWQ